MLYLEHNVVDLVVSKRKKDGYINASKLTKAYERQTGKYRNPNAWLRSQTN
ncbi:KilA-N domain-containing protein [Crocosphaera sp. Alani8]|uniref:KilA-N domain-containing protein n=1 Tax=Crocosphaera sp. Alani8 TaxID=3038952 RepID=UPI00313CFCC2